MSAVTLFGMTASASASVTINFAFGELRDSGSTVLSDGLWAIVVGSATSLPGGLSDGTSLDSSDGSTAWSAFSGKNITAGTSIGSFTIAATGSILDSSIAPGVIFDSYGGEYTAGQNWGLYWFPTLTTTDSTLGSGSFEVGGFFETSASTASGGEAGMVIPDDGKSVAVQYLESNVAADFELGPTPFTPARFTAITTITPTFNWDTDAGTSGAQGGTGTWSTAATNWNAGSSNYGWAATGTNNDSVFGATAGTVTIEVGGVTANDLSFNTTGYTITGGTLTLNGTTPTVTTASSVTATISSAVAGSAGMVKAGQGTLVLSGTNTYTGDSSVNAGTLVIDGSTAAGSTVTVASGALLKGVGTVGGNTIIEASGTHNAGNSIGKQTFSGNLTYQAGSIFEWDLAANTTTQPGAAPYAFDQVTVGGTLQIDSATIFKVVQNGSLDFNNNFWDTGHEWSNIFSAVSLTSGWNNAAVAVYDTNGNAVDVSDYGSFTITGSTLIWSAIPEPSNLVIGGLLCLGLLRRRRA